MAILRKKLWLLFVLVPDAASACPSCATQNQQSISQTLVAVGIMWLVPVMIATLIGFKIYQICQGTLDKK